MVEKNIVINLLNARFEESIMHVLILANKSIQIWPVNEDKMLPLRTQTGRAGTNRVHQITTQET